MQTAMLKPTSKLLYAALLSVSLLAACGGGGSVTAVATTPTPPSSTEIAQSVSSLVTFITSLITDNSENSDPIVVTTLTLATDDTAEPSPLK